MSKIDIQRDDEHSFTESSPSTGWRVTYYRMGVFAVGHGDGEPVTRKHGLALESAFQLAVTALAAGGVALAVGVAL